MSIGALMSAAALAAAPETWDCTRFTPPNGYVQETAFAPTAQEALSEAKTALAEKYSHLACPSLASKITQWKAGHDEKSACVMAVLEEAAVHECESTLSAKGLDAQLDVAVAKLLEGMLPDAKVKRRVVLAIDKIVDCETPGGPRATWLMDRMGEALTRAGLEPSPPPKGWAGDGVPAGFDAVLDAAIVERTEKAQPVLEVAWKARRLVQRQVTHRFAPKVIVPADVGPKVAVAKTEALPKSDLVSVRIEAGNAGSLCPGETTQLYVQSSEDRYVQIWDLYGKDLSKALLIFPNEDNPDGMVAAGRTVAVGPSSGFQALPLEGATAEQFLVIAAKKSDALGPFKGFRTQCRLNAKQVKALRDGRGLGADVLRSGDGFRIESDKRCAAFTPPSAKEAEEAVAGLPECR